MSVAVQPAPGELVDDDGLLEEADEKPEEVGWDWVYDHEMVLRDREESLARTEKARREWETTTRCSNSIKEHLSTLLVDNASGDGDLLSRTAPVGGGRWGGRGGFEGSAEQQRGMAVVAEKMAHTQERFANFNARRAAQEEAEQQYRQRIAAEIEASDARCLERQRELQDNQRRRAFNQAQRRSEQQKTLREFHREKERIWEAYYAKHHPSPGKSAKGDNPASASGSPSPHGAARGTSAPAVGSTSTADDDIYRSMLRSHGNYVGQLDQWRQLVAENERRTDTQWRKILHGASKEDLLGEPPKDRLRRRMKEVANMGRFLQRTSKEATNITDEASERGQSTAPPTRLPSPEGTQLLNATTGLGDSLLSMTSNSEKWHTRRQLALQKEEEKEQACAEKLQRDQQAVLEARQRGRLERTERAEKAGEGNRLWAKRNDAAAAKRAELGVTSDAQLVHKQTMVAERMAEEQKRRTAESSKKLAAKARMIMDVQAAGKAFMQQKMEAARASVAKIDRAVAERTQAQKEEMEKRVENNRYSEMAQQAADRRSAERKALVMKAKKEISSKSEKSGKVLQRQRSSVLEKERADRKERLGASSPMSAGPVRHDSGEGLLPRLMNVVSLPALPDAAWAPSRHQKSPEASEEEVEFLQELGQRSSEWLKDLRKKKKAFR